MYLKSLLEKYPNISSGRKNFDKHHFRIRETIGLIKKYFKNKK